MLRPREGLGASKISQAMLRDGIQRTTKLTAEGTEEDVLRINTLNNIIFASTPSMESKIQCKIERNRSNLPRQAPSRSYGTCHTTSNGVIHNIPASDSDHHITRSLVNKGNPKILQAKRNCRTIWPKKEEVVPYYA